MGTAQPKSCKKCGERFVNKKHPSAEFCSRLCSNQWLAPRRKSSRGFVMSAKGYKQIRLPNHPMASREGYVMEHRLVMAEYLGRSLRRNEVVHHKNGEKADNRIENLELMRKRKHDRLPKPPVKPIKCPHCGEMIRVSGRVRRVARL